jgi:hypothetical protein
MSVDINIRADLMAELQAAAERALTGVRDPDAIWRASERMDYISEDIRRRHGVLDISVPAIRELRDT